MAADSRQTLKIIVPFLIVGMLLTLLTLERIQTLQDKPTPPFLKAAQVVAEGSKEKPAKKIESASRVQMVAENLTPSTLRSSQAAVPREGVITTPSTRMNNLLNERGKYVAISDSRVLLINNTNMDDYPAPHFLPHLRNPCFIASGSNTVLELKCIPLAVQIGPHKCGTSQLYGDIAKCHPQILMDTRTSLNTLQNSNLGKYAGVQKSLTKQIAECDLQLQSVLGRKVESVAQEEIMLPSPLKHDTKCDFISAEVYDGALYEWEHWNYSPDNIENLGFYSLSRVLHYINPNQLFFGIFRDPVTRTLSDYKYFSHRKPWHEQIPVNPQEFHDMVEEAISWWYKCVSMNSERRCMFGPKIEGLPETDSSFNKNDRWNPNISAANRLRASMYCLYLKEFYHWFPRQNFLFIRAEDYRTKRIEILNNQLFPFLGVHGVNPEIAKCLIERGSNVNSYHGPEVVPFNKTIKMLQDFYRPFNKCFAEMVGDDAYTWGY